MKSSPLTNYRILVVEDEYLLADELRFGLEEAGAVVLGPAGSLEDTLELLESETSIDGAVLDTNLHGEMVFSAAEVLDKRQVPYLFTTGYDASVIPLGFRHVTRFEKPVSVANVIAAMTRMARSLQ